VILRKGYGLAHQGTKTPNTPETIFDIGSLAKQFTAAAILKLEMQGKLQVADPIGKYLPNVPADETAGGIPFRQLLRSQLFEPAGMHNTGFWGGGLPAVNDSLIARCYDESRETGDPRKWSDATWVDLGGGEVVSTVGDLYKWQRALASDVVLSQEARRKVCTPRLENYGYGCFVQKTPRGTTLIQHGGDYFGFGSQLSWFVDEHVVMIDLANRSNQIFGVRHVGDRLVPQFIFGAKELHMYQGDEFELPPVSASLTPELLAALPGSYQLETGGQLIIQNKDGELEIGALGQDGVDAIAEAPDTVLQRRARLNDAASRVMGGVARGDSSVVTAELLRPGASVEGYRRAFRNDLAAINKEKGRVTRIEVIGTAPGAYPVGVLHTAIRVVCERGSDGCQFNWVNERLTGVSGAPDLLAATPLKRGQDSDLVGWSIVWFKGFKVSYHVSGTTGKAESITLQHKKRTVTARRLS
jgi:beta-lactamase family protein